MREGFVVVVAGAVRGGHTLVLVHGGPGRTVAALNTELRQSVQLLLQLAGLVCLVCRAPALSALPGAAGQVGEAAPALDS